MPLVAGACVPPICLDVTFNLAAVAEEIYDKRKNRVDANKTNLLRAAGVMAPQVNAYKNKLQNVSLPCDGCVCTKPPPVGPLVVAPEDVGQPQPRWQPRIAGATVTLTYGICTPPPAGGGGGGGGGKAAGKPKKKATHPRR